MEDNYVLLEQYRIYNEAKDRFIDRTFLTNRFFIVMAAIFFMALLLLKTLIPGAFELLLGLEIFGIAVCIMWVSNQDAYSSIIKIKYNTVIENIEGSLPFSPNKSEYEKLTELRGNRKIVLVKDIQKWFAIILMLLFFGNMLLDFSGLILTQFIGS